MNLRKKEGRQHGFSMQQPIDHAGLTDKTTNKKPCPATDYYSVSRHRYTHVREFGREIFK